VEERAVNVRKHSWKKWKRRKIEPVTKIPSQPISVIDDPSLASSKVITVKEAMALLRCGLTHLYDLLGKGEIRSYKDGSNRRIYLYSVLAYQARQSAAGVAA
jgi:excisionase family DNA binding protein